MGRVIDVIFYSEMLVVFYLFIIDPLIYLVRHHDGLLPMLVALASRVQHRFPPPFTFPSSPSAPCICCSWLAALNSRHCVCSFSSLLRRTGAAPAAHDYAHLASVGGGGHVALEMGERRESDVSDDTL